MNTRHHAAITGICIALAGLSAIPAVTSAGEPNTAVRKAWLKEATEAIPAASTIDGADKPGVQPFPYTLKLSADPPRTSLQQEPRKLHLTLTSEGMDGTRTAPRPLRLTRADGNGWVDVAAVIELSGNGEISKLKRATPRTQGSVKLPPMWFPPKRPAFVRIRWKGRTDLWAIRTGRPGDSKLTLAPLKAPGARSVGRPVKPYRTMRLTDRDRNEHYRFTPFGLWREDGPKLKWIRTATSLGRPVGGKLGRDYGVFDIAQRIPVDDDRSALEASEALRTLEHSLLFRRTDGEIIIHCPREVNPANPLPDVHAAAITEINASPNAPVMQRYVRGLAKLDNTKATRLVVEIMLKSPDRPTAALAVAALERIHGDGTLWKKHYANGQTKAPAALKKRVATRLARKKEALRWWRKVGRPRQELLTVEETEPAEAGTGGALKEHLRQLQRKKEKRLGL
jgi:hypothetical protein